MWMRSVASSLLLYSIHASFPAWLQFANHGPAMQRIQMKITEARRRGDQYEVQTLSQERTGSRGTDTRYHSTIYIFYFKALNYIHVEQIVTQYIQYIFDRIK